MGIGEGSLSFTPTRHVLGLPHQAATLIRQGEPQTGKEERPRASHRRRGGLSEEQSTGRHSDQLDYSSAPRAWAEPGRGESRCRQTSASGAHQQVGLTKRSACCVLAARGAGRAGRHVRGGAGPPRASPPGQGVRQVGVSRQQDIRAWSREGRRASWRRVAEQSL